MATQHNAITDWTATDIARRFIARIDPRDYSFQLVRGIPCDRYEYRPVTQRGWTRHELLRRLREAHIDRQVGARIEDLRDENDRHVWIRLANAQTDVADVIAAEIARQNKVAA